MNASRPQNLQWALSLSLSYFSKAARPKLRISLASPRAAERQRVVHTLRPMGNNNNNNSYNNNNNSYNFMYNNRFSSSPLHFALSLSFPALIESASCALKNGVFCRGRDLHHLRRISPRSLFLSLSLLPPCQKIIGTQQQFSACRRDWFGGTATKDFFCHTDAVTKMHC